MATQAWRSIIFSRMSRNTRFDCGWSSDVCSSDLMLSAQTLAMVDAVCRELRRSGQPFGGLQTVLVGDFFQLPPVCRDANGTGRPVNKREANEEAQESFSGDTQQKRFAFLSPAWEDRKSVV